MIRRSGIRFAAVLAGLVTALALAVPAASAENLIECTHANVSPKGTEASCKVNPPESDISLPPLD